MAWAWVEEAVVLAIHDEQIAEHGGSPGLREPGMLASALARAPNLAAYGSPDVADLAAAYGHGIARNHAFVDGNKRTAAVVAELFLELNGYDLTADDVAMVDAMERLAAGALSQDDFADWLRVNLAARR